MPESRFCSNCRAELADGVDACPECGVYAGDLFDERSLRPRTRRTFFVALLAAVLATGALLVWLRMPEKPKKQPEPTTTVRVVGDRPGGARRAARAAINEAEATRLLRRHLTSAKSMTSTCLAIMSHGPQRGGYFFTAFNRCDRVRLGRWRIDGKSGEVSLAK